MFRGRGGGNESGEEGEELTPDEIVEAFCRLEPAAAWQAFRSIAADPDQPEELRVRAAAWLAIANAISSLQQEGQD